MCISSNKWNVNESSTLINYIAVLRYLWLLIVFGMVVRSTEMWHSIIVLRILQIARRRHESVNFDRDLFYFRFVFVRSIDMILEVI